jgi:hypothetical protein
MIDYYTFFKPLSGTYDPSEFQKVLKRTRAQLVDQIPAEYTIDDIRDYLLSKNWLTVGTTTVTLNVKKSKRNIDDDLLTLVDAYIAHHCATMNDVRSEKDTFDFIVRTLKISKVDWDYAVRLQKRLPAFLLETWESLRNVREG